MPIPVLGIGVAKVSGPLAGLFAGLFGGGGKRKLADTAVTEAVNAELAKMRASLDAGESNPDVLNAWPAFLDQLQAEAFGRFQRGASKTNQTFTIGIPGLKRRIAERLGRAPVSVPVRAQKSNLGTAAARTFSSSSTGISSLPGLSAPLGFAEGGAQSAVMSGSQNTLWLAVGVGLFALFAVGVIAVGKWS